MKNKFKRFFKKIIPILCVISVLLSLFSIIVSADGGTIGAGKLEVSDTDIYTNPPRDHGLPFSVTFSGMAYADMLNSYGLSNSYRLDEFGVTYPPQFDGVSIGSDQYARYENIPTYVNQDAYPLRTGSVYAHYDYMEFGDGGYEWYDNPLSYRYASYLIGSGLDHNLWAYGNVSQAISNVPSVNTFDLINENSYVASTVKFGYDGMLSYDLLKTQRYNDGEDYMYGPTYLTVYSLLPADATYIEPYYYISINGMKQTVNGLENKSIEFNSDTRVDGNIELYDYFYTFYIDPEDSDVIDYYSIATYYDDWFGLTMWRNEFSFGNFIRDYEDVIDVDIVTDIQIYYGTRCVTMSERYNNYVSATGSYPIAGASIDYYEVAPTTQAYHDRAIYNMLGHVENIENDFELFWLGNAISGIFDVDLFGSFGLGDILFCVIGIGIFIAFLKIFAGG